MAELIRHVAIIGIVGVALGLIVGGIGGRVLMRIAAVVAPDQATGLLTENGNAIGDITAGGTIELLVFVGILFGGVGAVAYVISERWLGWTGPLRPLAFGALLLAVASPIALDPDNADFLLVRNQELVVGMFMALFLLYGIPLSPLVGALEQRLPAVDPARPLASVAVYLSIVSLGLLFVLLLVVVAFGEKKPALYLLLALGLATALLWVAEHSALLARPWPAVVRLTGYGSLTAAAATGAVGTWNAIADILAGNPL